MRARHAQDSTGDARPGASLPLADFGLAGEQVDERFGGSW